MKQIKKALSAAASTVALAAAFLAAPERAEAQVSDMYLGQTILVGFDFCPRGTFSAEGQLLPIAQYDALFSLLGTIYGGDGRTTFALPDLRGRSAMGQGQGPGLPSYRMGQRGGAETRTLNLTQLPSHSHTVNASNLDGDWPGPGDKVLAAAPTGGSGNETIYSDQPPNVTMSPVMIANTGGNQSFSIMDPYLSLRYCVVSEGIYPSRQ